MIFAWTPWHERCALPPLLGGLSSILLIGVLLFYWETGWALYSFPSYVVFGGGVLLSVTFLKEPLCQVPP